MILDGVVGAAGKVLGDLGPLIAEFGVQLDELAVLFN